MSQGFACLSQAIIICYVASVIASMGQGMCMRTFSGKDANSKSAICHGLDCLIFLACLYAIYMACKD